MSKTLVVYPHDPRVPSFEEITALATNKLRALLLDFNISGEPAVAVSLRQKDADILLPLDATAPAVWPNDAYAWFTVPPIPGGSAAYFVTRDSREYWNKSDDFGELAPDRRDFIEECLQQEYYWFISVSLGQPAVINVAYGLVAGSFAELTNGFVYSYDGAWEFERFPATASEFFSWYFRPDLALSPDYKEWAETCIRCIPWELARGAALTGYPDDYK
jgi:hypothetical protein